MKHDKFFSSCGELRVAEKAKRKLAATLCSIAQDGEFRLVSAETVRSEIGTENVAYWDEYTDDNWFALSAPPEDVIPKDKWKHKYEIHGSGKTAAEAIVDYIVVVNTGADPPPSAKLPKGISAEQRLLYTIFHDGKHRDAEATEAAEWLRQGAKLLDELEGER